MFKSALAFAAVALVATETLAASPTVHPTQVVRQELHDFKVISDCDLSLEDKKASLLRARACKNKSDCKVLDASIKNRKHCQHGKNQAQQQVMDEEADSLQAWCTQGWSCISMMGFAELDKCIAEGNIRKRKAEEAKRNKKFEEDEEEAPHPSTMMFEEEEQLDSLQAWCSSPASCNAILQHMRNLCNDLSKY